MSEFVRVRTESGYEATVNTAYAEAVGAEVIDADATSLRGMPLPASRKNGRRTKARTTVKQEAAKKKAASPASDKTVGASDNPPEEAS